MNATIKRLLWISASVVVVGALPAHGLEDSTKCAVAKITASGKYAHCRLTADAKAELGNVDPDYTKCDTKLAAKWAKVEEQFGLNCPSIGDQAQVSTDLAGATGCLSANIANTAVDGCDLLGAQQCGDNRLDPGEACDQAQLGGATCSSATGGVKAFGSLACGADCELDTSACVACPAGAVYVNGVCWLLGAPGDSCLSTCALAGMAYDEQTRTYTGSDGSLGHCCSVLSDLGIQASLVHVGDGTNLGCYTTSGGCYRNREETTAQALVVGSKRRVCACH